MKFTITALPTFEEEVTLPHYRHGKAPFTFKYVPPSEIKDVMASHVDKKASEVLPELIMGWGVKDDDGNAVPYTPEALEVLLGALPCGQDIYMAWVLGNAGAKAKN